MVKGTVKNYYALLGVARNASMDEIRIVFRNLARRYDPQSPDPQAAPDAEHFAEILQAYNVLIDENLRSSYDRELNLPIDEEPSWLKSPTKAPAQEVFVGRRLTPVPIEAVEPELKARQINISRIRNVEKDFVASQDRSRLLLIMFLGVISGLAAAVLLYIMIRQIF